MRPAAPPPRHADPGLPDAVPRAPPSAPPRGRAVSGAPLPGMHSRLGRPSARSRLPSPRSRPARGRVVTSRQAQALRGTRRKPSDLTATHRASAGGWAAAKAPLPLLPRASRPGRDFRSCLRTPSGGRRKPAPGRHPSWRVPGSRLLSGGVSAPSPPLLPRAAGRGDRVGTRRPYTGRRARRGPGLEGGKHGRRARVTPRTGVRGSPGRGPRATLGRGCVPEGGSPEDADRGAASGAGGKGQPSSGGRRREGCGLRA